MRQSLARRERHDLCDLALELGPSAATLCDDWTAHELLAHLWVREHRPQAALGMFVPPLSFLTDAAMARAGRTDFTDLVRRVREPGLTPFALGPVDALANTLELLVHHEDLRRGHPAWQPRVLDDEDLATIWRSTARMGRALVRRAGVPVTIRRADTGEEATLRGGAEPVVLTGPVVEVVLTLFGRGEVRDVEVSGPPASVAAWRDADRSV